MSVDGGAAQLMISLGEDQPGGDSSGPVPPELRVLATLDWRELAEQLDRTGFARAPALLSSQQCAEVIDLFGRDDGTFRSTW
jgi:hypothetical protein